MTKGFWTVWAVSARGSPEPEEQGSEQCLGRHSGRVPLVLTCSDYKRISVSLDVLKKIRQNLEICCPTRTIFGRGRTEESVS